MKPIRRIMAVLIALGLPLVALVASVAADHDNDPINDGAEAAICSSPVGVGFINLILGQIGGGCQSNSNLVVPPLQGIQEPDPDDIDPGDPCTNFPSGQCPDPNNPCASVPGGCPDTDDSDGDGIPNLVETTVCGSNLLAQAIGMTGQGSCTGSNLVVNPTAPGLPPDTDGDMIPDAVETAVCSDATLAAAVQATGQGSCVGNNLTINPVVPGVPDSDGDGVPDAVETLICNDPTLASLGPQTGLFTCAQGNLTLTVTPPNPDLGDSDGDGVPNLVETTVCGDATLRSLLTTSGQGSCLGNDLTLTPTVPAGPPNMNDADQDNIPDQQERDLCTSGAVPSAWCEDTDADGTKEDLHLENALDAPLGTVLNPICAALGANAPAQVCVLKGMTAGQAACFLRNQVPIARGALVGCSAGGDIWAHCSRATSPDVLAQRVASDADCDGDSNILEIEQGCDPLDPTAHFGNPGSCEGGPLGAILETVSCAGSDDPAVVVQQLYADADCDGDSNVLELSEGCNPFNPNENLGNRQACTLGPVGQLI